MRYVLRVGRVRTRNTPTRNPQQGTCKVPLLIAVAKDRVRWRWGCDEWFAVLSLSKGGVPLAKPRVRLSAVLLARITVLRGAAPIRHALTHGR